MNMNVKSLSFRELDRILSDNGYKIKRKTSHYVYEDATGDVITFAFHSKAVSMKTVLREFKKHNVSF